MAVRLQTAVMLMLAWGLVGARSPQRRVEISHHSAQCAAGLMAAHFSAEAIRGLPPLRVGARELHSPRSPHFPGLPRVATIRNPEAAGCRWPLAAVSLTNSHGLGEENCFNAALLWQDPQFTPSFVSTMDMEIWLRRSFNEVPAGAELRFGDVLAIFAPGSRAAAEHLVPSDYALHHAAIIVSPGLVWHKPSSNKADPYTFEETEQVVAWYAQAKSRVLVKVYRFRHDWRHELHEFVSGGF